MIFVDRVIDFLASEDVIDLYFILSDLKEINITEAEFNETVHMDSQCEDVERHGKRQKRVPWGKQVW